MRKITKQKLFRLLGNFKSVRTATTRCYVNFEDGEILQFYNIIIAARINGQYYFTLDHDCSPTTCRHTKEWCGLSAEERRKGIDEGKFVLIVD